MAEARSSCGWAEWQSSPRLILVTEPGPNFGVAATYAFEVAPVFALACHGLEGVLARRCSWGVVEGQAEPGYVESFSSSHTLISD
jgi:hypothetical protein